MTLAASTLSGVTIIRWENCGPRVTVCFQFDVLPDIGILFGHRFATLSCGTASQRRFAGTSSDTIVILLHPYGEICRTLIVIISLRANSSIVPCPSPRWSPPLCGGTPTGPRGADCPMVGTFEMLYSSSFRPIHLTAVIATGLRVKCVNC
jgi:hypothetical protein